MNSQYKGSAHQGLGEWIIQRVSALYLAGFLLWLVVRWGLAPLPDYEAWKSWFGGGVVRVAFGLFFLSLLTHTWVGMRSVFLDYLHPLWLRFSAQLLAALGLLALALWAAEILLVQAAH